MRLKIRYITLLFLIILTTDLAADQKKIFTEIPIEIKYGLAIISVNIKGENYRFLFDTGAKTAISESIQSRYHFKKRKSGKMTDSTGEKRKVKYVSMDSIRIGKLKFSNVDAFISDFQANPMIGCLDIDGIIGSNTMSVATWRIDYQNKVITISDQKLVYNPETDFRFSMDRQKSILIKLKTNTSQLTNLKVDYGSTGSLSVPDKIFKVLEKRGEFDKIITQIGFVQSGLFGKRKKIKSKEGMLKQAKIDKIDLGSFPIKSGSSGLLGTKILGKFLVTIDWKRKIIRMERTVKNDPSDWEKIPVGFGWEKEKLMVLSVSEQSIAFQQGIRPGQVVVSYDGKGVHTREDFCTFTISQRNKNGSAPIKFLIEGIKTPISLPRESLLAFSLKN